MLREVGEYVHVVKHINLITKSIYSMFILFPFLGVNVIPRPSWIDSNEKWFNINP